LNISTQLWRKKSNVPTSFTSGIKIPGTYNIANLGS
jgi:hypothetical protein